MMFDHFNSISTFSIEIWTGYHPHFPLETCSSSMIHSFPFFCFDLGGGYVWDARLKDVTQLVATDDAFAALRADGSVVTFGDSSGDCRWDWENYGYLMTYWC